MSYALRINELYMQELSHPHEENSFLWKG